MSWRDLAEYAADQAEAGQSFMEDGGLMSAADCFERAAQALRNASAARLAEMTGAREPAGGLLPKGRHDVGYPKGGAA